MSVVHLENVAETVFAPEAKVRFVHGENMTLAYWSLMPSDFPPPPHWARAVTDRRVLDIFHPVREDYRSGDFTVIQT